MTRENHSVTIFTLPQKFPCGQKSTCCGPVGQSEEDVNALRQGIEKAFNIQATVTNLKDGDAMQGHSEVVKLFNNFGPKSTPMLAVDGKVVSMGNPRVENAIDVLRSKIV